MSALANREMPKSRDLGVHLRRQQDVGRLDVLVDDALLVRARQRVQYLQHDADGIGHRHRALVDHLAHAHAVDELHGQERLSFVHGVVVDRDDVGMGASRGGLGLAAEAPHVFAAVAAAHQPR